MSVRACLFASPPVSVVFFYFLVVFLSVRLVADLAASFMDTSYLPVTLRPRPKKPIRETAESRYWKSYGNSVVVKYALTPTDIDFCSASRQFVISASTNAYIYNAGAQEQTAKFSKFHEPCLSATLRPSDGKLLAAGTADALIKIFEISGKSVLRMMRGHTRPIRRVRFLSPTVVVSVGDDAFTKLWDVATGTCLSSLEGHSDYIRSLATISGDEQNVFATGSYDHTARIWDRRLAPQTACVRILQHSKPVEALCWTGNTCLAAAAGNVVTIWNAFQHSSGVVQTPDGEDASVVIRLANHQKTVTSLAALDAPHAAPGSNSRGGPRLLSAGLDHLVKVYDISTATYEVVHSMRYDTPIMSLGVSLENLVSLHADSSALIKRRSPRGTTGTLADADEEAVAVGRKLKPGTTRYFMRTGAGAKASQQESERRKRLGPYDKFLKAFEYGAALDTAVDTKNPIVVFSVLEELRMRDGLDIALSGRDETTLEPLLHFLAKYIVDPTLSGLLVQVAERLLDIYASVIGQSPDLDDAFFRIRQRLREEMITHQALGSLLGQLELLMTVSDNQTAW